MAIVLIVAFDAEVTKLIQLYIVGVFVSFNLSQLGMIRHWTRHLRTGDRPAVRRRMMRSRAINTFGLGMTAVVLVIVLVTKFLAGAWIAILAMGVFFLIMKGIRRHYDNVGVELAVDEDGPGPADPGARDRAGLQAAQADDAGAGLRQGGPAERARGGLRRHRPAADRRLLEEWDDRRIDVPLKVLHSPYREIIKPIVDYAAASGTPTRAAWSRSTSPSTSSGAGGSSCCTTRPRCGSRAGCCSPPA